LCAPAALSHGRRPRNSSRSSASPEGWLGANATPS
jgi:hypothetical protein